LILTAAAGSAQAVRAMANPMVVFPAARQVRFEDSEISQPGPDEVLIRTRRTMISTGTELTIFSGEFPERSAWAAYGQFPFRAGYSSAGEVVAAGAAVSSVAVGDLVATLAPHARFSTVPAAAAIPVRGRRVPLDQLPFVTLAQTVMNGVRRSGVAWGDAVAVFGVGLLGQLAVRFCRLAGAWPVVAIDVEPARLARLPADAAVVRVNAASADMAAEVARATSGRMADIVFEVTGNPGLIPAEFAALKPQDGRVVMLSSPRGPSSFDFHDLCNSPSHTIIGAHMTSQPAMATAANPWTAARNGELFLELAAAGEIDLDPLITHRLDYTEGPSAYQMLHADRSGALAVILNWDEGG
jgi:2-desacetyl-2-hydroxyethyl bacteriochlorophyllide A dehydrogenase